MMFFGSKRKKATVGAEAGLRPIIAVAQMKGGLSTFHYSDPYLLGFLSHIAVSFAKTECRDKQRPEDIGFALQVSFTNVFNLNGPALAERATEMMVNRNPQFQAGADDAAVYFLYAIGVLQGHEDIPLLKEAKENSGGPMAQMFGGDERSDVGSNILQFSFLQRVDELRGAGF